MSGKEAVLFLSVPCLSDVFGCNGTYKNAASAGKEEA